MKYFRVKNLEKYQHYKDRNPAWIKLQTSLLNDVEFCLLTDIQQLTFIKLILLSSQNRNRLVFDSRSLRHRLGITSRIDLRVFVNSDMIEIIEDTPENASTPLAPRREENINNIKNKKTTPNSKKPESGKVLLPKYSEWDLQTAKQFRQDILSAKPDYKFRGSVEKEAQIIRLMREIDKREKEKILSIWQAARSDSFWSGNILSPNSLRRQFDTLEIKFSEISPQETEFEKFKRLRQENKQ